MAEAVRRGFSMAQALAVAEELGLDLATAPFDAGQFRMGMEVEVEHGRCDPRTDVTHDDPIVTGKIALAHMKEYPDYYERLARMEAEAERDLAAN